MEKRRIAMGNVSFFPGGNVSPDEPNGILIEALEVMLLQAKSGELRSLVGIGFDKIGNRLSFWYLENDNVFQTLGAIAWLEHEYVEETKKEN